MNVQVVFRSIIIVLEILSTGRLQVVRVAIIIKWSISFITLHGYSLIILIGMYYITVRRDITDGQLKYKITFCVLLSSLLLYIYIYVQAYILVTIYKYNIICI